MQYEKHKRAKNILNEIDMKPERYLIVHYSCESFYDIEDGKTPRITSIAVYFFKTAQTESFSIHKVAEKNHIELNNIEFEYDRLEREMLDEYFMFVKSHSDMIWIHWNMRNINYGFKAIEHRYEVLGGVPEKVLDYNKIDLSRLFIDCYGNKYIGHPRLSKLMELNDIDHREFLSGADEAEAFKKKEYVKLHQSTLRKVDILSNLLNRAINRKLKVNTKWYEITGINPQSVYEYAFSKWYIVLLCTVLTLLIGAYLGKIIK